VILDSLGIALVGIGLVTPTLDYLLKKRISRYASIVATFLALVLSLSLFASAFGGKSWFLYNEAVKVDAVGAFLSVVTSLSVLLVSIASFKRTQKWATAPSYFSLLLLIATGAFYIVSVNDTILLLAGWALVSLGAYAFIGVKKDEQSLQGATKYALMGIVASTFMLFGIAILIGLTGTTDIAIIQQLITASNPQMVTLAVIMFITAFGFKLGIVPFHGWLPDVYGNVDPLLVSFIASVTKILGMAAIFRILVPLSPALGQNWFVLFAFLSIITMTFGNIAALTQRNIQKMMAYSAIAHVGYMLVGFAAVTTSNGATIGMQGIILHLTAYALATVGIFVALSYLIEKGVGTNLNSIRELWRRMPILSVSMIILDLSLLGTPPFLGFWSKFIYLFTSPLEIAPWLTLIAIINTGISVGYYGQILRYMFLARKSGDGEVVITETVNPQLITVVVCATLTVVLGLVIGPFFSHIIPSV
jgi:proton-translocating NADH-quinone oxidoreductase chain N